MWRTVTDNVFLSEVVPTDKAAYLEHLKEKEIYDWTLSIPFPYTEADADRWIAHNLEEKKKLGVAVQWAIRNQAGYAIGGIGFHDLVPGETHKAEIGYWLAKPFWGQGIMPKAVTRVCEIGVNEFELVRITATIFSGNQRSAKVLQKCGFQLEGNLKSYYLKDGKISDGQLYALIVDPA